MKQLGGLSLSLILAFVWLVTPVGPKVYAACSNVTSYGAVDLTVPTLPGTGELALWVRMQSTSPSARVMLEANGNACFEIAGSGMTPSQWSWQAYKTNGKVQSIKFANISGNQVKLIGIQAGVKIDKVMLTKPDCIPQDFGNNCTNSIELAGAQAAATALSPPSGEPVVGAVSLTSTPDKYPNQIKNITYTVGGKAVQTLTAAGPFDTTLIPNGKHTVMITTELKSGQKIQESTVVEVNNPENAFTPMMRWLRVNKNAVIYVAGIVGLVVVAMFSSWWLRRTYVRHRERKFHGF